MGRVQGYVLHVILIAWTGGSLADQHFLPAPENLSIVSINMKHSLRWEPVMVAGNVSYSVQSQGEYETIYVNHIWHEAENCQEISTHQCNVTAEVTANVLYRFRVQAILGDQLSAWAELQPPFSRTTTILTPPKVDLQVSGLNLVAHIEDYGPYFHYFVFYWQKGEDDGRKVLKTSSTSTLLGEAAAGKEYCAEVIAYTSSISRNSSSSDPICVQVKPGQHSGLFTGLLCVFGIVLAFLPMVFAGWKVTSALRYFCCPNDKIPDVLASKRPVKNERSDLIGCYGQLHHSSTTLVLMNLPCVPLQKEPYIKERMLKNRDTSKERTEETCRVEIAEHLFPQGNSSHTAKSQRC